jgi:hypothetical protein
VSRARRTACASLSLVCLADGWTPTAARLRTVARDVQLELAIAVGIVIVAATLVAQLPGQS